MSLINKLSKETRQLVIICFCILIGGIFLYNLIADSPEENQREHELEMQD